MVKVGDKLEVITDLYVVPKGTILTVKSSYADSWASFYTDNPIPGTNTDLGFWSHALTGGYLKKLISSNPGPLPFSEILHVPTFKISICECGADKHGFASHSQWCGKA